MSFLTLIFEYVSYSAKVISELDYLYIEWFIGLFVPHLKFLFLLVIVPFTIVLVMFIDNLIVVLTKIYILIVKSVR